jgi:uncharacterized membrane protein YfcA
MVRGDHWHLFGEGWFMSLTMAAGSFIAGATAEGGGAVAFPAMTLLYGISPGVARDFSLLIQAVGMNAAAVVIVLSRTRVEWSAVLFAGLGGAAGVVVGISWLSGILSPAMVKMFFVSFWLGFGVALFWIHRRSERLVRDRITELAAPQAALLVGVGFVGGLVSGVTGSGLDIVTFSLLTLYFGVCVTVATPTSVILMGNNALVGALWTAFAAGGAAPEAWGYWYVCVPIVVVGAPTGAWFMRERSFGFIVRMLLGIVVLQYTGALWIIPQSASTVLASAATIVAAVLFYAWMARRGDLDAAQVD